MLTRIKTDAEIEAMRYGGKALAGILKTVSAGIYPGINAAEIDGMVAKELARYGVKPAFLGFQGFPANICVSLNDEVVHGIPTTDKVINNGDVVSLDLGVVYKGMIVDGALSMVAGEPLLPNHPKLKLLEATRASLKKGISVVKPGCRVGDISNAIQNVLEKRGLGIVKELVGHGVGHNLHEDPNIPNFGKKGTGMRLSAGMTIAIEPMAALGGGDIYIDRDGWTVKTRDKSLSAQFEHTVLITDKGCEVLTDA